MAAQLNQQDPTDRARGYAGAPSASQPAVGQKAFKIGDPEVDAQAVSANTEFAFSDSITGYAFATASNRDITSFAFFRAPGSTTQNILSVYPQGFLPEIQSDAKDRSLVAGVRGSTASGWDWDASYTYGDNRIDFHTRNTLNVSLGPTSPTSFYDGALETTQNIVNLNVKRGFDWGLAYPVTVAFGAEYRNETWNQSPGEVGSYFQSGTLAGGAQGFGGFARACPGSTRATATRCTPTSKPTSPTSSLPVWPAATRTTAILAARPGQVVRAPCVHRQDRVARHGVVGLPRAVAGAAVFPVHQHHLPGRQPESVRDSHLPANSTVARALGAEPLDAETSLSYSLGLVLQPTDALYLTVDAYQIEVNDRIVLSSNLTGAGVRNLLESQGIFGINGGRYFTNAVDTRTRGVDVVGSYRWQLAASSLDLTAGYNYSETEVRSVAANPAALSANGLSLERIDRTERGRIEEGFPRDKFLISGSWNLSTGRWPWVRRAMASSAPAQPTRATTRPSAPNGWWMPGQLQGGPLDADAGRGQCAERVPGRKQRRQLHQRAIPYSNLSPFGFNGAYVYGRINYRW